MLLRGLGVGGALGGWGTSWGSRSLGNSGKAEAKSLSTARGLFLSFEGTCWGKKVHEGSLPELMDFRLLGWTTVSVASREWWYLFLAQIRKWTPDFWDVGHKKGRELGNCATLAT